MSERMRSSLALVVALAAAFTAAKPSLAQTPGRVQVRLTGAAFTEPIVADYLGGLATLTEVVEVNVGDTRIPGTTPAQHRVSDIRLRRTQVDNALALWRKQASDGLDYRREVVLEFVAPGGNVLARFRLAAAWLSSYSIAGSLAPQIPGATPRTVGVEAVTLVMESLTREQ